ncbi:MAG: hypothetical protein WCD72_02660 [Dehalococcoidia bacterium]
MITVGDIVSIASIFKVGASLGASLDEIKSNLPAITKQALDINAELTKLQSMPQLSQTLQIDLSVARDSTRPERHDISGDTLQALDITGDLNIRFNQIDSQAYNVNKTRRLTIPFDTIFLSNAAQTGKVATLVFGKGGLFQIQDVSPAEINIIASEVTLAISIESSTIMMPIDIQSSYIMMPIDIQAQYMDLAIDIVAQSIGNIKMDMAAQSIGDIAINIAGQISDVDINLQAQNIAIKSQGEWSPQEGQQKYWYGSGTVAAPGVANVDYTVTEGKTLYITHFSFSCGATTQADRDLAQNGKAILYNYSTSTWLVFLGGNGGDGLNFTTPIKFTSGQVVRMIMQNVANHSMDMYANWGGYEI